MEPSRHRHNIDEQLKTAERAYVEHVYSSNEQQREAELAEIAPDWLCYPIIVLFAPGWVVLGLMRNLRWPGCWVAIAALATITWYVVQLKLRCLPKLRQELQRESRWSRSVTLLIAPQIFAWGIGSNPLQVGWVTGPGEVGPTAVPGHAIHVAEMTDHTP
ncbi:MAG: hypothetical protein KDA61_00595 [Planctomycetales bacterium]|nr:hypothetical protein [Planctomycetales bacterium]